MNILDYLILIIIILGALYGYKRGFIGSLINFIGTIVVIILAFYLKNPISVFLYEHFPFFKISGFYSGISVYNILIYEGISFLITLSILSFIFKIISKITGLVSKLTLGIFSEGLIGRILGLIFGLFQGFLIAFFICFLFSTFSNTAKIYQESKYGNQIVSKTPFLSDVVEKTYLSIKNVYDITLEYQNSSDKEEANKKCLEVLLKYEIISKESAEKLSNNGKLGIKNIKDVINNNQNNDNSNEKEE